MIVGGAAIADHTKTRADANDTPGHFDVRKWNFRVSSDRIICRADFFGDMKLSHWNSDTKFACGLDYVGGGPEDGFIRVRLESGNAVVGDFFEREDGGFVFQRKIPAEINAQQDFAVIKLPRNEIMGRPNYIRWRGFADDITNTGPCHDLCRDAGPDSANWYRYKYH